MAVMMNKVSENVEEKAWFQHDMAVLGYKCYDMGKDGRNE